MDIANVISMGAVICAAVASFFTALLVRNGEKTAYKQLRAYVSVSEIQLSETNMRGTGLVDNWRVSINLKNGGKTPSVNMVGHTNCSWSDVKLPQDFDYPDNSSLPPIKYSLGPEDVVTFPCVDIPIPVIEKAKLGNFYIYIWGWVDYDDVISNKMRHRTEFCVQMSHSGGEWGFIPYGKFNGFDEGCFREPSTYIHEKI